MKPSLDVKNDAQELLTIPDRLYGRYRQMVTLLPKRAQLTRQSLPAPLSVG